MKNFKIYWGETLNAIIEIDDSLAVSATLTINTNPKIIKIDNFLNGEADVSVSATETQVTPGVYDYQLKVIYQDGTVNKFPDIMSCSGCKLPTITIVESVDMPSVS